LKNIRYHGVFTPEKTFNQKSPVSQGRHPNRKIGFNRPFPCFDVLAEALAGAEYFCDKQWTVTSNHKLSFIPSSHEMFLKGVHALK